MCQGNTVSGERCPVKPSTMPPLGRSNVRRFKVSKPLTMPPEYHRPAAHSVKKADDACELQLSLRARLSGLRPVDLHPDGVAIFTVDAVELPHEFQDVAHLHGSFQGADAVKVARELRRVPVVLVCCNIHDEQELRLVTNLSKCLKECLNALERPPVVLVPLGKDVSDDFDLTRALNSGIDAIIAGGLTGRTFASEVRKEFMKYHKRLDRIEENSREYNTLLKQREELRAQIEFTVWNYLPRKIRIESAVLPAVDTDIHTHEGAILDGSFTIGRLLGTGSHGDVYRLDYPGPDDTPAGQVVKLIGKEKVSTLTELQKIGEEIRIMQRLSSHEFRHPNIVQLYEVYHSPDHLVLRMQDGGSRNLFRYMKAFGMKRLPLDSRKAECIFTQCLGAVCHMHLKLNLVHRDIKPENIIVAESSPTCLHLQLCDFDLASYAPRNGLCKSFCGTFPFHAPEMVHPPYDPFPADIWSLGVVFLEVACGCDVVTRAAIGDVRPKNTCEARIMTDKIGQYLERLGTCSRILEEYTRPELKSYVQDPDTGVAQMLQGMLSVPRGTRLTAEQLQPQS